MSDPENPTSNSSAANADDKNHESTVRASDSIDASSISPNSIEGLFLLALQKSDPADRVAFLKETCGNDEDRHRRVSALLRAFDDAGSFLETPAGGPRPQQELSLSFLKPSNKEGVLGTIGPYEVLEVIGRGGMGVVLRAVDLKLNRVVAVKALLPELAANPNSRRRFLREAQAAAAISHPHVVTIHAVDDTHEDTNGKPVPPYLVMECVVGQSLQEKLDRVGPMRLAEILRISRQIGDGLAAAHKQGLIHRDIKPANILLENGVERVKITDFGLARAIDDITVTRTGEVSGTPQYMSPEQACGERVDHRSDLFSLGCVMYAMCTGHSPFRGDSIAHVIKRVTQDTPRPIADQNPEIPNWLIEIIDCLLQKNPEQRFQSAEGIVAILDQHLSRIQHPTESGSHSAINQQGPSVLRSETRPVGTTSQPESVPITEQGRSTASPLVGQLESDGSSPDTKPNRFDANSVGTILIGLGATLLFSLVAWFLLVAFDVIGASPWARSHAGDIAGCSILATFVLVFAGLLLKKQLRGHAAWKDMLALAFYSMLGPLGIGYWVLQRMNRSLVDAGPAVNEGKVLSKPPHLLPNVTTEQSKSETVQVQFGSAAFQVPLVNYQHYAAVKRIGLLWILLTIFGVLLSLVFIQQSAQGDNSSLTIRKELEFQGTLLGLWILQILGILIWRVKQVPARSWAMLSSASFACMAFGHFWATVLRMPTPLLGTEVNVSPRMLIGTGILPTMVWLGYCWYVINDMCKSPQFLKQFASKDGRSGTGPWIAFTLTIVVVGALLWTHFATQPSAAPAGSDSVEKIASIDSHPIIVLQHPAWGEIRELMINRGGSSRNERSSTKTEVFLETKHLGTPINIHVILMDGREWARYGFPVERLKETIVISEADLASRDFSLVEVVEDAPSIKLQRVGYPTQHISVHEFSISKAPFHKTLQPGSHRIKLQYVVEKEVVPDGFVQFHVLDYRVIVQDAEPLKLSLAAILEEHSSEAKIERIRFDPDFRPLPKNPALEAIH